MLDPPPSLRGTEGGIEEQISELSVLSALVKKKPRHAYGRIKFLLQEIYNTTKYQQSLLTISCIFFWVSRKAIG